MGVEKILIVPCIWSRGQEVKTLLFHGGNPGSTPGGITIDFFKKKCYNIFIKERKHKMFDDFTLRISCEEYYDEDMWELIYGAENGFDRAEKD